MLFNKYVFAGCQEKLDSITSGSLHNHLHGFKLLGCGYEIYYLAIFFAPVLTGICHQSLR